jgi:hypothetical protein
VVDVKCILSVVAMVPHSPNIPGREDVEQHYFVVEKIGLEVAEMCGVHKNLTEN